MQNPRTLDRLNAARFSLLLGSIASRLTGAIAPSPAEQTECEPVAGRLADPTVLAAVDELIDALWPLEYERMVETWRPSATMTALATLDNWRNGTGQTVTDLLGEIVSGYEQHAGCFLPHTSAQGPVDCAGRAL